MVRNVDYAYFLHNTQNFNINLVDIPDGTAIEETTEKITISSFIDENEDENDYLEKVDSIDERNINDDVGKDAYKAEPVAVMQSGQKRKFRTNPLLGKLSIKKAYYQCECDYTHVSFISKKTPNIKNIELSIVKKVYYRSYIIIGRNSFSSNDLVKKIR